jgi:acyl carrier protein
VVIDAAVHEIVHDIIRRRVARSLSEKELFSEETLGGDGLGLDSIAIAEVLLDCEQRFGVSVVQLLGERPLTLGRLVAHLEQAARK